MNLSKSSVSHREKVIDYCSPIIDSLIFSPRGGSNPAQTLSAFGLSSERCFTVTDRACPNEVSVIALVFHGLSPVGEARERGI